jgi:hypothetical protein
MAVLAGTRRHAEVVEWLHGCPCIGLVAFVALVKGGDVRSVFKHCTHVVACHVATRAIVRGSLVHAVDMTGSAAGLDMSPGQGKPGSTVIELDRRRIDGCRCSKMQHDQQRQYQQQSDPPRLVLPDTCQFILSCLVHLASP